MTDDYDDQIQQLARATVLAALQPDVPLSVRVSVLPFVLQRVPAPPPAKADKGAQFATFVFHTNPDHLNEDGTPIECDEHGRPLRGALPGDVVPTD